MLSLFRNERLKSTLIRASSMPGLGIEQILRILSVMGGVAVLSHLTLKSYNCDNKYSDLKRVSLCAVTPLLNTWLLLLTDPSLTLL